VTQLADDAFKRARRNFRVAAVGIFVLTSPSLVVFPLMLNGVLRQRGAVAVEVIVGLLSLVHAFTYLSVLWGRRRRGQRPATSAQHDAIALTASTARTQ